MSQTHRSRLTLTSSYRYPGIAGFEGGRSCNEPCLGLWSCIPGISPFAPPSQLPKTPPSSLETGCPIIHPVSLARSHPSASQPFGDTSILGIPVCLPRPGGAEPCPGALSRPLLRESGAAGMGRIPNVRVGSAEWPEPCRRCGGARGRLGKG